MTFLQKVSFCKFIRNNPRLFSAYRGKKIVITVATLFLILYCNNEQSNLQDEKRDQDYKTILFLNTYLNSGECLRQETTSASKIYTCSKLQKISCSINTLITTSGELIKIKNDTATIIKKSPECTESSVALLKVTQSSNTEISTIKSNNVFTSVESCRGLNLANTDKLTSNDQTIFLNSTRGKIGLVAYVNSKNIFLKTKAENCLLNQFSESERLLIEEVSTGVKVKEVSCTEVKDTKTCGINL
jgi:hypothetical protein